MKIKFLVPIQSMTDVITNSSSELFVISDSTKNIDTVKGIIDSKCNEEPRCSGDGGMCEIETIDESFWGDVERKEFYDWPEDATSIGYWFEDDTEPNYQRQFPKGSYWEFECKHSEKGLLYTVPQLQDWFLIPMSEIYEMYISEMSQDAGGLDVTGDMILVEIDWAYRDTIDFMISELGATKVDM